MLRSQHLNRNQPMCPMMWHLLRLLVLMRCNCPKECMLSAMMVRLSLFLCDFYCWCFFFVSFPFNLIRFPGEMKWVFVTNFFPSTFNLTWHPVFMWRGVLQQDWERKKKEKKEKTIFIYSYIENDFWDYNLIFLKRK